MSQKTKGKFIVIDGTDGSGKATQVKLLARRLKAQGRKVKTIDFPRYYNNFFGKFIGQCLAGEYGNFLAVSPYFASVLYAADRFESAGQIKKWLAEGNIVIADRYASSNQIHQGAKINDAAERKKFLDWLEKMEFKIFKIPKPDLVVYLDVPLEITQKLLKNKEKSRKKRYLNGKNDVHESDWGHLQGAKNSALDLVAKFNNWVRIDCASNGKLMSKKEINNLIYKKLKTFI
ncbi:MAG: thymidylate kinase Tmk [Parcubacteria group bacterium LiPW_39]|nr:MAG: thymidylate kinase Tmk [Parcubacteria group bacterium LiPW_39]